MPLPTRAALNTCIAAPVMAQYRLTSRTCLQLLHHELCIGDVYQHIRNVLLGASGGVLQNVLDGIEAAHAASAQPALSRLQTVLDEAVGRVPLSKQASVHTKLTAKCAPSLAIFNIDGVLH